ncbi:MAG: ATP-binding protein, partial [Acidimicrobiales bacterium]
REVLAEVGLDPGTDLRQLEQRILEDDESLTPGPEPVPRAPNNLPAAPNRLIGRDRDIQSVRDLLNRGRLVTLLGPGGAGKTRLSIAIGEVLLDRYPGGVWFVSLDSLDDGSLLAAEVGRISGMRETVDRPIIETLALHLGGKRSLLVLDNCEHLVDPVAAFVQNVMARCANLSILVTSQVTVEAPGEAVFSVAPLALPGETTSIYDPITDSAAVALFVERARDSGVNTDGWNDVALAAVANIVSALDGLPLAVELAAARTRSMSLEEIAEGLSDRFTTLSRGPRTAPERQRSLRGALEWSLNLLDDRQRRLMDDLSVLAGGFDSDDAAAVSGMAVGAVRDDLTDLVNRSLLRREPDLAGAARFRMLESLRQYRLASLDPARLAAVRDAHLRRFAGFTRTADAGLRGIDQLAWLHRIDASYQNIRNALEWSVLGGSLDTGVGLVADIGRYWDWRGLLKEGSAWTDRLGAAVAGPVQGLASLRAWRVFIAWERGDLEAAKRVSELAIEEARELNDPYETAVAVSTRLLIGRSDGDFDAARSAASALAEAADAAGDPWMVAWAASALTSVHLDAGELAAAREHAEQTVDLFTSLGDRRGQSWGRLSLAQVELHDGTIENADRLAAAALKDAVETEDDRNVLWALEVFIESALRHGDYERAARLWGASQPLREARGLAGSVSKLSDSSDIADRVSEVLGDVFAELAELGRGDSSGVISEELARATSR